MNYKETAKGILEHVGGVENISNMSHCATRLRLNLKDETLANEKMLKRLMVLLMSSIKLDNIKCLLELKFLMFLKNLKN